MHDGKRKDVLDLLIVASFFSLRFPTGTLLSKEENEMTASPFCSLAY